MPHPFSCNMLFDNGTTKPGDFVNGIIFHIKFYWKISGSIVISKRFFPPNILWCIMIQLCNKNQQNALFHSQFISIINLYIFRASLLLIIGRYFSVYTAIGVCHVFMLGLIAQENASLSIILQDQWIKVGFFTLK